MVDKLHKYEGFHGQFHRIRETAKAKIEQWKEDYPRGKRGIAMNIFKIDPHSRGPPPPKNDDEKHDWDHDYIFRRKTRSELVRISAAVMGIEFSYAAETAFVSPTLLKIGVTHKLMTMVWGLSPLLGFFMTPILGSLSDRCTLALGRRRPFILILSLGVFLGLILVPNGEKLGYAMGDVPPTLDLNNSMTKYPLKNLVTSKNRNATLWETPDVKNFHPWGVFFTVLGTVLLDFNADSCQSPARAYLLDVSSPEDHARGLSTFTIMAGLGGFFGYAMGGINWDITFVGEYLGGHVRAVFSLITILFVVCVFFTVTSFKEIPLKSLKDDSKKGTFKLKEEPDFKKNSEKEKSHDYGAFRVTPTDIRNETNDQGIQLKLNASPVKETQDLEPLFNNPSLKEYLLSIVFMPRSLRIVCLTNLFCWMSHVCYSLYFTDFVGEAVFNGDPSAPKHSREYELYEEGVRFGCWGMSMYSLSCSCYSLIIEGLIQRYSAKKVYVGGLAFYSVGMLLMAMIRNKIGVILFSWTAGVMYSTLFTMPYLLVAHYHANGVFELTKEGEVKIESRQRGLGTDVGIVSSMVFLAQFILAMAMGEIVSLTRTTTAVVSVASFLAFCGAITATKVMYLHL